MSQINLKNKVRSYWNEHTCGTDVTSVPKFSRQYFEEIEEYRYWVESEIFSFAQFTRYRDKRVLEVGVGSGTDFIQWVRAGANAYGIDLTEEGIKHTKRRLETYGLHAEEVRVADAENLPYSDNFFDLVYSWGVLHHSPNTIKALEETIRVTHISGRIKIMIYNRKSLYVLYKYLQSLLRGKIYRSFSLMLFHEIESIGTKAYTIREVKNILSKYPVRIKDIRARANKYDLLWKKPLIFRFISYILVCLLGYEKIGFFMTIELEKIGESK